MPTWESTWTLKVGNKSEDIFSKDGYLELDLIASVIKYGSRSLDAYRTETEKVKQKNGIKTKLRKNF